MMALDASKYPPGTEIIVTGTYTVYVLNHMWFDLPSFRVESPNASGEELAAIEADIRAMHLDAVAMRMKIEHGAGRLVPISPDENEHLLFPSGNGYRWVSGGEISRAEWVAIEEMAIKCGAVQPILDKIANQLAETPHMVGAK